MMTIEALGAVLDVGVNNVDYDPYLREWDFEIDELRCDGEDVSVLLGYTKAERDVMEAVAQELEARRWKRRA